LSRLLSRLAVVGTILAVVLGFTILAPITILIATSFTDDPFRFTGFSAKNYLEFFTSEKHLTAIMNSVIISLGATVLAVGAGTCLAWLTVRTDIPFKRISSILTLSPYFFPPYIGAMAWVLLANPQNGILNNVWSYLFKTRGPFNIYSWEGLIWVLGVYQLPLSFLMVSAALRSLDFTLEQQSFVAGAGVLRTLRRINIPLLAPTIINSSLLTFIYSIELFTVPLFIGAPAKIDTLPVLIYRDFFVWFPPNYGRVVTSSTILLAITIAGMYFYYKTIAHERRFATITGKGFQVGLIKLGKWRNITSALLIIIVLVVVILPLSVVILSSFVPAWTGSISILTLENYFKIFSREMYTGAIINSFLLSVLSATILIGIGLFISYIILRTSIVWRKILDYTAMLPAVVPGIVFGYGLLLAWVVHIPLGITGTLAIMLLALTTRNLPFSVRTLSTGFLQIDRELEEAATTNGSSYFKTFFKITLPLLRTHIIFTFFLLYTIILRDLGSVLFVTTGKTMVVPVLMIFTWTEGDWVSTSTMAVILICLMAIGVYMIEKFGKK
jgi:iron(III) transport system permease protein